MNYKNFININKNSVTNENHDNITQRYEPQVNTSNLYRTINIPERFETPRKLNVYYKYILYNIYLIYNNYINTYFFRNIPYL